MDEAFEIFNISAKRVVKLYELCNQFTLKICGMGINQFKILRVDFCFNLLLNNRLILSCFLNLFAKGDVYNYGDSDDIYNNVRDKKGNFKNGIKYRYGSFALKIYNKGEQLRAIKKNLPNGINACLRFEIELHNQKITSIQRKNGYENLQTFLFNAENEARSLFYRCLKFHFKEGVYLNFDSANKYIDFCREQGYIKKTTAIELKEFTKRGLVARSIFKARPYYKKSKFVWLLNKLEEINLNPVTIPERWNAKGRDFAYLPSVCSYISVPENRF